MTVYEITDLATRAAHYRTLATDLRALLPSLKSEEARREVLALAQHYESLARVAESSRTDPRAAD